MFLRSFSKNSTAYNPRTSFIFTVVLGLIIFGYFYFFDKVNKSRYRYFGLKENRVLYVERTKFNQKDTVSWLCRRVNIWRYYGTNLGLYSEDKDFLIAEFQLGKDYLTAIYNNIPFFDIFDKSGQKYGISLLPANLTDSSRWTDEHLGMKHEFVSVDTLIFNGEKVDCVMIETRLSFKATQIIENKLSLQSDSLKNRFDKIKYQSWLNWYSTRYGWLKTVYPDGRILRVVSIKDIYWFERICRYLDFGVMSEKFDFYSKRQK